VLRGARTWPAEAFLGIDANAAAMRRASHVAARRPDRGGLPNAAFAVAAAEALPHELTGRAGEVRITLPWGSLLRAAVRAEPWLFAGLARLLVPGGEAVLILSVGERDHAMGLQPLDEARITHIDRAAHAAALELVEHRAVTRADVDAAGSTWARRLAIPERRAASLLRLRSTAMSLADRS
jgi:16S rRNA (adenine(1408)-N(1))-methyltransferase